MKNYFAAADLAQLSQDHPIGDAFTQFANSVSRDELFAHQDKLFQRCLVRAWETPFYQRLWGAQGIEAGDIQGLDDIAKLPTFDKSDLMASIDRNPPFGDFSGVDLSSDDHPPVVFHTTSGTTGKPQVLLFGAKSREAQNLLLGRVYRFQGLKPSDVVHSVYGHGMINGGHYIREAMVHWTNSVFMSAGTGIETRSVAQVELMRDFGATVIVGFADYLKRLAEVASELGISLADDINIRMISGQMGREDKSLVSQMWGGAECFDWYGVGDTGVIAAEGPDHEGMYIMEDAQYLELLDIDSGEPVGNGKQGDMVSTCLFKDDVYPIIRFNTHDVSQEVLGTSSAGYNLRRIEGFMGRSDNMVKIKGINVFPQAVGPLLDEVSEFSGEFICRVNQAGEFLVQAEVQSPNAALADQMRALLRRKLGIEVGLELVGKGDTASATQIERRQKPIRLIDEREIK